MNSFKKIFVTLSAFLVLFAAPFVFAASPTPTPDEPLPAASCTLSPSSATVSAGEALGFTASCKDSGGGAVSCPALSWSTTVSGGEMISFSSSSVLSVSASAPAQIGKQVRAAYLEPPGGSAQGGNSLYFAEGDVVFSCSASVSVEVYCVAGRRNETHSVALNGSGYPAVVVGDYRFEVTDMSSRSVTLRAKRSNSADWDLCSGSPTSCSVALEAPLRLPLLGANAGQEATVSIASAPVQSDEDDSWSASLNFDVRCAVLAPSCVLNVNPSGGIPPFSTALTATFFNISAPFGNASFRCQRGGSPSGTVSIGSNGIARFTCRYETQVSAPVTQTVSAANAQTTCSNTVTESVGRNPFILSPSNGQEFWTPSVNAVFRVGTEGECYSCEYGIDSLSSWTGLNGVVSGGVNKTLSLSGLQAGGHFLTVRCSLREGETCSSEQTFSRASEFDSRLDFAGEWLSSETVSFFVNAKDVPVIINPEEGYRVWGTETPLNLVFKIGGSEQYECYYYLDGSRNRISGYVSAGEKTVSVIPQSRWVLGSHSVSVGCTPDRVSNPPLPDEEQNSGETNFTVTESDKPVVASPLNGSFDVNPVDFRYAVGGGFRQYDCVSFVEDGEGRNVLEIESRVNTGAENVVAVPSLTNGVYSAWAECAGVSGTAYEEGYEVEGSSSLSFAQTPGPDEPTPTATASPSATPTPAPTVSSEKVSFTALENNKPFITVPESGEVLTTNTTPLVFVVGGSYNRYDCEGFVKNLLTSVTSKVYDGRVEANTLGERIGSGITVIAGLNETDYSLNVVCSGLGERITDAGLSEALFAGISSDPVDFSVELPSGPSEPRVDAPVISEPIRAASYAPDSVSLTFVVTGSFASYTCSKTLDSGSPQTIGAVQNGTANTTPLLNLSLGTHTISVSCSGDSSRSASSETVDFNIALGGGGGGGSNLPCSETSDCPANYVCVNDYCSYCWCGANNLCNSCCAGIGENDPDCAAQPSPTPGGTPYPTATPRGSPTPRAGEYSLSLEEIRSTADVTRVTATLLFGSDPACDAQMSLRVTFNRETKTYSVKDAGDCHSSGAHVFEVDTAAEGTYELEAYSSLGGGVRASAVLQRSKIAAGFVPTDLWLVVGVLLIVLAVAGYYYYEKKQKEKEESEEE